MKDHKHGIAERGRRFLRREYWNIGVVEQSAGDIAARGITAPVRWLPPPSEGVLIADPGCLDGEGGGRTLFAEYLDYRAPRGEIWTADLAPGQDMTEAVFRPLLATAHHMSYPRPFRHAGRTFLICESWQSGGIPMWERIGETWHERPPLLQGRKVVDPTLLEWQGRWWLFCTFQAAGADSRLHIFHAPDPCGPWLPHAGNPVRIDPAGARPAGPVFAAGDALIRPAQDCSRTYGGAVVLHAITCLTPDAYDERTIRRIEPRDAAYPHGLHTLCPAGPVTLIDGKRWGADPAPLLRQVAVRTRRVLARARR